MELYHRSTKQQLADAGIQRCELAGGSGCVGTVGTPGLQIQTIWNTSDLWLRRTIQIDAVPQNPALRIHHDENAEVLLNGIQIGDFNGFTTDYQVVPLTPGQANAIQQGENLLAVHVNQTAGGQYIDVQLVGLPGVQDVHDQRKINSSRSHTPRVGRTRTVTAISPKSAQDGFFVTFTSEASNLVQGDDNNASDVFLYEIDTNQIELLSVPNLPDLMESEPNNDSLAPQNIEPAPWNLQLDQNVTESRTIPHATISGFGDGTADYYRFNVAHAGARGIFDIDSVGNFSGTFDPTLDLYDVNGSSLEFSLDQLTIDNGSNDLTRSVPRIRIHRSRRMHPILE